MIVLDPPQDYPGKFKGCSHLVSDKPGAEGTEELITFAKRAGLLERYIQKRGTYKEHFDVFGRPRGRCVEMGAKEITRNELGWILIEKRKAMAVGGAATGQTPATPAAPEVSQQELPLD